MGYTKQTFLYLQKWLTWYGNYTSICELGDQMCMAKNMPIPDGDHMAKYFKHLSKRYLSIDLNGKGGALPVDLNKDLDLEEQFDIVTDFGCLDEVVDYYMGFKNTHKLCKIGGLMIHILPIPGHWEGLGYNYAGIDFFDKLGKVCKYIILDNHIEKTLIAGDSKADQVYIVYRKVKESAFFVNRNQFRSFGYITVEKGKTKEENKKEELNRLNTLVHNFQTKLEAMYK